MTIGSKETQQTASRVISDEQRELTSLRARSDRLDLVMQATNEGIWDWDLRSDIVYYSPRWKAMLGYREDEIGAGAEDWYRLVHADDLPRVRRMVEEYLAGRAPGYEFEHRLRHRDGSYRWILTRGVAVRDAAGVPYRLVGSHTDITAPKQAQALLEGQRRFLAMLATGATMPETLDVLVVTLEEQWPQASALISLLDADSGRMYVGAYGRLPASYVDSLDGLAIGPTVCPGAAACQTRGRVIVEDVATDPHSEGVRDLALAHGLRACWAEPFFGSDGEILGALTVYSAVSRRPDDAELDALRSLAHLVGIAVEHKRAESELRHSEARFRTVFSSAAVGMIVSAPDGEIIDTNPALQRMLGFTTDELRQAHPAEHTEPGIAHLAPEFRAVAAGNRDSVHGDSLYRHKDGRKVWGRLTHSVARDDRGNTLYHIAMLEDITERKLAQDALEAAYQTLERRVAERTRELSALNAVASAVSSSLDLVEIMRGALHAVVEALDVDVGSVYVLDATGGQFDMLVHHGLSDAFVNAAQSLPVDLMLDSPVFDSQQPVTRDLAAYPDVPLRATAEREGLQSITAVPLTAKQQLLGALVLSSHTGRTMTDEETALLLAVGRQVGLAAENARLYQAEQARLEEADMRRRVAEGLRETISALNSEQSLDETLNFIAGQSCRVLGCDGAAVMYLDPAEQVLSVQASCGLDSDFVAQLRLPIGQAAAGRAVAERRPMVVPSTAAFVAELLDRREMTDGLSSDVLDRMLARFKALVAVPLLVRDEPYGAITLYYAVEREFSEEDVRLAQSVANQAALAIESSRLRARAEQAAAVAERNRLARELHDSVTQNLYSVTLYAEAAARLLDMARTAEATDYLRNLRDTAQEALREMRLLIFELRPPDLEKNGLAAAIQARLQAVEARGGLKAHLRMEGLEHVSRVPLEMQQELYYIAQEALNNTLKHSQAEKVDVSLCFTEEAVRLEVSDDGRGFDLAQLESSGGIGATSMRERAERIGARLAIESVPGGGTTVSVATTTLLMGARK